jgi:hypothetical protein
MLKFAWALKLIAIYKVPINKSVIRIHTPGTNVIDTHQCLIDLGQFEIPAVMHNAPMCQSLCMEGQSRSTPYRGIRSIINTSLV